MARPMDLPTTLIPWKHVGVISFVAYDSSETVELEVSGKSIRMPRDDFDALVRWYTGEEAKPAGTLDGFREWLKGERENAETESDADYFDAADFYVTEYLNTLGGGE